MHDFQFQLLTCKMCFSSLVECWWNHHVKTTSDVDNHPWPCRQLYSATAWTTEKKWILHGSGLTLLIIDNNKSSLEKFNNKGMMRGGMILGDIVLNNHQIPRAYISKEISFKVAIVLMYHQILRTYIAHTVPNIWRKNCALFKEIVSSRNSQMYITMTILTEIAFVELN